MGTFRKYTLTPTAKELIEEVVAGTISRIEKGDSGAARRYLVSIFDVSLRTGVKDPMHTLFSETLLAELGAKADANPEMATDIRSVIKGVDEDIHLKRVLGHMPRGSAFNSHLRRKNI